MRRGLCVLYPSVFASRARIRALREKHGAVSALVHPSAVFYDSQLWGPISWPVGRTRRVRRRRARRAGRTRRETLDRAGPRRAAERRPKGKPFGLEECQKRHSSLWACGPRRGRSKSKSKSKSKGKSERARVRVRARLGLGLRLGGRGTNRGTRRRHKRHTCRRTASVASSVCL